MFPKKIARGLAMTAKKAGEEVVERLDRRENDQDEQKRKQCVDRDGVYKGAVSLLRQVSDDENLDCEVDPKRQHPSCEKQCRSPNLPSGRGG